MTNNKILDIYHSKNIKKRNFILKIVDLCDLKSSFEASLLLFQKVYYNTKDSEFFYDEFLKYKQQFLLLQEKIFKLGSKKFNLNNNEIEQLINYVQEHFKLYHYPNK
ncbi:MAG: hypothetical protein U9532_00170 ['Conium maculatum' witches'-broom phytoplasma]|nr:hypothetical protein ['Conium maculatum' witches'-broom phytoplasma]